MKNTCDDCGKALRNRKAKRCRNCFLAHRELTAARCEGCGKLIRGENHLCWQCYSRKRVEGKPRAVCQDCGAGVYSAKNTRCRACTFAHHQREEQAFSEHILEEYMFFAEFGFSHEKCVARLAQAFGLSNRTIVRRLNAALGERGMRNAVVEGWRQRLQSSENVTTA